MIKWQKLVASFKYALCGFRYVWKHEQSFRLQLVIAALVIVLMLYFPLHRLERAVLILVICLVLSFEIFNTQLERVLDLIQPNHDPRVKAIKDLLAAIVLIAVLGSVVVGLVIFLPYLI